MKNIFASKTVWVNAISFILIILALPELGAVISSHFIPYIALINAILNTILRVFFTSQTLTQTAVGSDIQ